MFDWAQVTLVLGLCSVATVVYGIATRRASDASRGALAELKTAAELLSRNAESFDSRLAKVETALRIDGKRAMAEAARGNLPAFMKMLIACVSVGIVASAVLA